MLTTHLHLMLRLRTRGAALPFFHKSAWLGALLSTRNNFIFLQKAILVLYSFEQIRICYNIFISARNKHQGQCTSKITKSQFLEDLCDYSFYHCYNMKRGNKYILDTRMKRMQAGYMINLSSCRARSTYEPFCCPCRHHTWQ
jgi:hypothetical protein